MRKLINAFKNLPPELRLLVAMAGLATPLGLIFILQRAWKYLFGYTPSTFLVIIALAALVGVLSLLGFLGKKLLGEGSRQRNKKMESELAGGAQTGHVSMDLRAAIKSNNDKFFGAIRDMKKNAGISVYDLPWYIVIGDAGCGKTKLINEGGLVFSTGKPEGYQLGTLNYNWWFTEDAVFVDMAGRLCNPQDDADRREWMAFLDTIAKGRRGFPINGAVVCVSAEHLLQDSPEKQEQDANTTLERLRDLQNKLGVTFATYLVVTKCDKILGFMQFFDAAGRDIAIKNQVFGWSRPGSFNDPYDPELFGRDFDGVSGRLNELRLRRLYDEADEIELGLAYSFPEEFRELRAPLQTYVRTLFPLIKNPKAVKNLIFRGVYFTSATQVGGVILKRLSERLGAGAADQFPPLESLYPQPRPHFVKDLLARKVIPEHGLVFRNEKQVMRNRKLSRLLKVGSAALGVVVIAALTWSVFSFGSLIGGPRENAKKATTGVVAPNVALAGTQALGQDVDRLVRRPWPARILSLGIGASEPIKDLKIVQVRLFEEGVLKRTLAEVDQTLRTSELMNPRGGPQAIQAGTAYMDALEEYVAWYGCMNRPSPPPDLTYEGLQKLCKIVPREDEFYKQAGVYFSIISDRTGDWKNPARLLRDPHIQPAETIRQGIRRAHDYLAGYATLSADHPDPVIREWMRNLDLCNDIRGSYDTMLASTTRREVNTQKDLADFKAEFVAAYDKFAGAVAACAWRGGGSPVRIGSFRAAVLRQRALWVDYKSKLDRAARKCQTEPDPAVAATFAWLVSGDKASNVVLGLDLVLAKNLKDIGLSERGYIEGMFGDDFPKLVTEPYEHDAHIIAFQPHKENFEDDRLVAAPQTQTVQSILRAIRDRLSAADFEAKGDLSKEVPSAWIPQLERLLSARDAGTIAVGDRSYADAGAKPTTMPVGDLNPQWRPAELAELQARYQAIITRGEGTRLLTTIATRLTQGKDWGLAELYPDWREKSPSAYQMQIPGAPDLTAPPPAPTPEGERPRTPGIRRPDEGGVRKPAEPVKPTEAKPLDGARGKPTAIELEGLIPACATHDYLNARAWDCVQLMIYLGQFSDAYFLPGAGENRDLNKLCIARLETAGRAYTDAYVRAWGKAYDRKQLPLLDRLRQERGRSWNTLAEALSDRRAPADAEPREISKEFQAALQEVLQVMPWATYHGQRGWWKNQTDKEWTDVASWLEMSIKSTQNAWPAPYRKFVTEAQLPNPEASPNLPPWAAVAQRFDRAWTEIVTAMAGNAPLPREFNENAPQRPEIPWGAIRKLREDHRLTDEKVTGELAAFVRQAQGLLSAEMTDILYEVQEKYFQGLDPYDGWPYVNPAGEQVTALETVGFKQFKDFLFEVGQAARVFGPLENGIPDDDPLKPKRMQLYRSCQQWWTFIGFDAQGTPADLPVEVRNLDPLDPTSPGGRAQGIDDTAQNYYGEVQLYLGFAFQDPNQPGGVNDRAPLKIGTRARGESGTKKAWWRWTSSGGESRLKMQFAAGIQGEGKSRPYPESIAPTILGTASPLAPCAYLHRYAKYDGQNGVWVAAHAIDLAQVLRAVGAADMIPSDGKTRIGAKFAFKLDRPMPEPIKRLQRASPPTATGGRTPR